MQSPSRRAAPIPSTFGFVAVSTVGSAFTAPTDSGSGTCSGGGTGFTACTTGFTFAATGGSPGPPVAIQTPPPATRPTARRISGINRLRRFLPLPV
ncbi:MAG: hypothetical protein AB1894_29580 [Chloroflexota bacterium]